MLVFRVSDKGFDFLGPPFGQLRMRAEVHKAKRVRGLAELGGQQKNSILHNFATRLRYIVNLLSAA